MVLCHGNSGKILSDRMSSLRLEYLEYPDGFSTAETTFLDSSTIKNAGVANEDNWEIDTTPTEWVESKGPSIVDVRTGLKDSGRD